ncbi:phosphoribosylformylglycinamidine cyclo-ligase [Chloroflexales bacterium ZM16-3]|nr:phosphoribosylformylglycinamidine cyclo-ligase [Chloroflexales bacterium ZM16-3]
MSDTYAKAGVDIAAATRANELMAAAVRATHGPAVLAGMGAFGGCFDASLALAGLHAPVLVASTDGVGTKTLVAAALGRYDTVGQDLVNHCVNDILAQGARPLFFLDYVASARLDPEQVAAVVGGAAKACKAVGCALLGGETAEMPDVYAPGAFDLAGTIIGAVDRAQMLPRPDIAPGDAVLALPSSGLHTNGYSLARRIVDADEGYHARPAILGGQSVGEALLAVHRSYLAEVDALRAAVTLKGLAHITGGGLFDNLPRALPEGMGASIRRGSWQIPPIFTYLVERGGVAEAEAFHALNMGLGMLAIVPADAVAAALAAVPEARHVGEVTASAGVVLA